MHNDSLLEGEHRVVLPGEFQLPRAITLTPVPYTEMTEIELGRLVLAFNVLKREFAEAWADEMDAIKATICGRESAL